MLALYPVDSRVLIIFAHPAYQRSRVNRHLVRAVRDLPGITFHDVYEAYPDFMIDVEAEQELLSTHKAIIFQHPLFWYSTPAILKEWQDLVLTHGWAYGTGGDALKGKTVLQAITAGGSEEHYREGGLNRFPLRHLLTPFDQTCTLCQMTYVAPFVVHGTHKLITEADMIQNCAEYRRLVEALRDGQLDVESARELPKLNGQLDQLIGL
ncbi:MAG: NAD(P)H-dependent oxidoreductase [Verrucomicrobiota bacterium]